VGGLSFSRNEANAARKSAICEGAEGSTPLHAGKGRKEASISWKDVDEVGGVEWVEGKEDGG